MRAVASAEVRLASEAEGLWLCARFPRLSRADVPTDAFVAKREGRIVGGASVAVSAARVDPIGPGCWVESASDDAEAESLLLDAVERHASAGGAKALYSLLSVLDSDDCRPSWERLGFTAYDDAAWMLINVAEGARVFGKLLARRSRSLRDDIGVGGWKPEDDEQVAALQQRSFGGSAERARRFVSAPNDLSWRREWSAIARLNGRVIGMCLVGLDNEDRAVIASLAVEEGHRKTTTVTRLVALSCGRGVRDGVETARMLIGERGGEALRIIQRLGAVQDGKTVYFSKHLRGV